MLTVEEDEPAVRLKPTCANQGENYLCHPWSSADDFDRPPQAAATDTRTAGVLVCEHSDAVEDQRTRGPRDQRTRGPEDQEIRGPEYQGGRGPEDQMTRGPEDQRTRGPEDQRTRGPEDQRTRGPKDQGIRCPGDPQRTQKLERKHINTSLP